MNDFGVDLNLSEFFSAVGVEKKKKRKEIDELVSNSFDDFFIRPLQEEISQKKIKEPLIEDDPIEDELIEDILEEEIIPEENIENLIEKSLGLLAEPSNVKQQKDPLTPLDQKFATLEDLDKHYKTFLNRIQQQLSTLGGGGETRLEFLDDVDRNSVKVDNKFLKYNSSTGKWIGSNAGGGGPVSYATTYVTTTSYTITQNDYYVGVNTTSPVTITLPTLVDSGTAYIVKDELGQASQGTNRYITILPSGSDQIDGQNRAILAYDFGSLTFVYRNGWRVV